MMWWHARVLLGDACIIFIAYIVGTAKVSRITLTRPQWFPALPQPVPACLFSV